MSTAKVSPTDDTLRWIVSHRPGLAGRAEWKCSAAVAADGTVFVPAAVAGNEQAVFLIAAWEGEIPVMIDGGHLDLAARWIAKEYPDVADVCALIERRCLDHLANEAP